MHNEFIEKLKFGEYITLETTPPKSPTLNNLLENLKKAEVDKYIDGFTTTDSPLAKMKYNSILAAIKIQNTFNKPVISTMSMRDRNKIALQGDLLGANDFDILNILALTGDSAKMSDQPNVKGVFEGNSIMLLEMIRSLNVGLDYAGRELKEKPKKINAFGVTNSYAKNLKNIEKKIYKKVKSCAVGIITQPVFDIDLVKQLIEIENNIKKEFKDERKNFKIILGVFPITRLKTAQFISTNVPGIYVPDIWIEKLIKANKISPEEEYKVGIELSRTLFQEIKKIHPTIHLMTANRFNLLKDIF